MQQEEAVNRRSRLCLRPTLHHVLHSETSDEKAGRGCLGKQGGGFGVCLGSKDTIKHVDMSGGEKQGTMGRGSDIALDKGDTLECCDRRSCSFFFFAWCVLM